jgi:hypothetical protein
MPADCARHGRNHLRLRGQLSGSHGSALDEVVATTTAIGPNALLHDDLRRCRNGTSIAERRLRVKFSAKSRLRLCVAGPRQTLQFTEPYSELRSIAFARISMCMRSVSAHQRLGRRPRQSPWIHPGWCNRKLASRNYNRMIAKFSFLTASAHRSEWLVNRKRSRVANLLR